MQAFFFGANISKQKIIGSTVYWLDDSAIDSKATQSTWNMKLSGYQLLSQHNKAEICGEIQNKKLTAKRREIRQRERIVEQTRNSLIKSNNDKQISRYVKYEMNNIWHREQLCLTSEGKKNTTTLLLKVKTRTVISVSQLGHKHEHNLRVWQSALGGHKTFAVWSNLNK